jgi:dephospho-CoA kinase
MLRVALTGGIATGKSYVRARVAGRGTPTVDADAIVHALLAPGSDVPGLVAAQFGASVLAGDGGVDRARLAQVVFQDAEARASLEAIVHPRVYDRIEQWFAAQARAGAGWVLADIPLLFETHREGAFDRVVVAACPVEVQVRRVMHRDGASEAAARARIAAQWPIADKVRRATDVVDTGGSFEDTNRQVDALCWMLDESSPRPGPRRD